MKIFSLILVLFFGLASTSRAQQKLFVLGGLEPEGRLGVAVKNNIGNLEKGLKSQNWSTETYFGDGTAFEGGPATKKGLQRFEDELLKVTGGKVIIYIDGHGLPRDKNSNEISHSIPIEGGLSYSLDNLLNIGKSLTSRGVQVAIVDMTCFSGTTQMLAVPGVCVITSAAKDYLSGTIPEGTEDAFDQNFIRSIAQQSNLSMEEVFLKARLYDTRNFPQISSLLTPDLDFFNYFLKSFDPSSQFRRSVLTYPGGACYACAVKDYFPETAAKREDLNTLYEIAQKAMEEDLRKSFIIENSKLKSFMAIFQEISKVSLQYNPIVDQEGHAIPPPHTGYEGWSKERLLAKYENLEKELFFSSVAYKAAESVFYHQYHTGSTVYFPGQSVIRKRKNGDCSNFKNH